LSYGNAVLIAKKRLILHLIIGSMFLFTQVGMTSNTAEQAALIQNVIAQSETTTATASITVLPTVIDTPTPSKPKQDSVISQMPVVSLSVEQTVKKFFSSTPVLAAIARCESTYRQVDGAGNVLRGKVNRKDIGVMQINEQYHSSRARALGIDLYSLEGNLSYAKRLYREQGTSPWISSEGCWGSTVASAN